MVTLLFKEDISKNKELIEQTILDGGIIIYPTDTLYGIGGRGDSDEVVKKIYELKKRDENKPLSIIVPDFNFIFNTFKINDTIEKNIRKYLPGAYTILLEVNEDNNSKNNNLSPLLKSKENKIGVRICDHYIQDIVFSLKIPLIATSANISGQTSPSEFEDLEVELLKKVDLVIIDDTQVSGTGSKIFEFSENNTINYIRK
ncbi:MAG: threonylcarbamoyl-AMP synthase [Nanoarchaeota archaeon]|nr:threonylcarbamoyl-AMP synthase [Nanoarchaeota archaeon]